MEDENPKTKFILKAEQVISGENPVSIVILNDDFVKSFFFSTIAGSINKTVDDIQSNDEETTEALQAAVYCSFISLIIRNIGNEVVKKEVFKELKTLKETMEKVERRGGW